ATYSYAAIEARKAFTISIPSEHQARMADFVGMESGKDLDKFSACHLEPVRSDLVDAPYVAETPLVLECRLLHTLEIGLHTLFVGEILDVKAEESVIGEKGKPDILKVQPMLYDAAGQHYFGIGRALGKAFDIGSGFTRE
ncbi:MAG TPA: flavin reductase family protein, partial [Holophaga sp.]|nr:flavin reductase family protein [Holophaga sp.]